MRLGPPHRVCTLDSLINEIVTYLLVTGELAWPQGHRALEVIDDWSTYAKGDYTFTDTRLTLSGREVSAESFTVDRRATRLSLTDYKAALAAGKCSHADVRRALELYLADFSESAVVKAWLKNQVRCLIIDEVFDANELDIHLLRAASEAGVSVFAIGDPWQALYAFRGARPHLIPELVKEQGFRHLPLLDSFRFKTPEQIALAEAVRGGSPVELVPAAPADCDIVLASWWKTLWACDDSILPLAFTSSGSLQWAIVTLILNAVLESTLGVPALHIKDALRRLGVVDETRAQLRKDMEGIAELLAFGREDSAAKNAWESTVKLVQDSTGTLVVGNRKLAELKQIARRLRTPGQLVLGTTIHQAKGREWDTVGVALTPTEMQHLSAGLEVGSEIDRALYVALTRARFATRSVTAAQQLTGAI